MSILDRTTIILCRPEGSLNIGSVCRAMKNSGLSRLSIVGDPVAIDRDQVTTMAIHARDLFDNAHWFATLNEAVAGHVLAAGLTRRRGTRRKYYSHLPEELVDKIGTIKTGKVALVFGNERNGLTDSELKCCDMAVHIPASPQFPSLNLSHAVQIMGYLLYRKSEHRIGACTPLDLNERQIMIDKILGSLDSSGFFAKADRDDTAHFLKDVLSRALLGKRESERFIKIFGWLGTREPGRTS